jgi:hypothetical protein
MTKLLDIGSVLSLGLLAGSLLLEGLVLVPTWKTLRAAEFFELHKHAAPLLFRYFAPLTTVAVLLSTLSAIRSGSSGRFALRLIAPALSIVVLGFFPAFFKSANEAFAKRTVADEELSAALRRWAHVHSARTGVSLVAFATATSALLI